MELEKLYELIKNNVPVLGKSKISTRDSVNYVLAEPVYSPYNRPLYDLSHVDGYAVRYEDIIEATPQKPVVLSRIKGVNPRKANEYVLGKKEAVFVETGYPIPVGADLVIPIEDVVVDDDHVYVKKAYPKGSHVFPRGSDYAEKQLVFDEGTRITPFIAKTLLDLGIDEILVYKRPRFALFSIGDEIVDEPFDPTSWKLPASTRIVDRFSIEHYGGIIVSEDIIPDNPSLIERRITEILDNVDLVVTIGGVSMGPRDYTWITLMKAFKPRNYWRGLKIHPARSTSGLLLDRKIIINQPGLHQSALSALILVITPVINYLQGLPLVPSYQCIDVKLKRDHIERKMIDHYRVRPVLVDGGEGIILDMKGSYYLSPINNGNAFTVLKPGIESLPKGSVIKACCYPLIHNCCSTTLV